MKQKLQIVYVPGGMTFKSRKDYLHFLQTFEVSLEKSDNWTKGYLDKQLGKDFHIIRLDMPLKLNARYEDWKIYFERYLPHIKSGAVFIGYSLGGIFLAKYLSENTLPKKAASVCIVAAPYDNSLPGEDLVNGFKLDADLSLLEKNTKNLHFFFSRDDMIVEVEHAEKYRKKLPYADFVIFENKGGHFRVSTFPELVRTIKKDTKK